MSLQIGFGKVDITPRVGVEMAGFGPYLHRVATDVRDPLYARAVAFEANGKTVVVVSCDIIGITSNITRQARQLTQDAIGLPNDAMMVHCTHTHSGPATASSCGWGEPDAPYLELLPRRIAAASIQAVQNLQKAELFHAQVPCEGIGYNRLYDTVSDETAALTEGWRPAKPELTDTTCHVFRVEAAGRVIGFFSYFGCHPVVCASMTTLLHGDYAGVATNMIEHDYPGAVGLFLQGAQGDVNTCVVHQPQEGAMHALDIVASRYARAVREGLGTAEPLAANHVAYTAKEVTFSRQPWSLSELRTQLAEQEQTLHAVDATDDDMEIRMAMVYTAALRRMIAKKERNESLVPDTTVQGFRVGPVSLLAAPFEIFQAIKKDICHQATAPIPLVMSFTNSDMGYAVDRTSATTNYEGKRVPFIKGQLPYANIHDELVAALLALDTTLTTTPEG